MSLSFETQSALNNKNNNLKSKNMFHNLKILNIGKFLFWLSFILGNACLFGFLITHQDYFAIGGYFLLLGGTVINLIAFTSLITYGFFNQKHYDECLKTALILLINIPFAVLYAWIGLEIM